MDSRLALAARLSIMSSAGVVGDIARDSTVSPPNHEEFSKASDCTEIPRKTHRSPTFGCLPKDVCVAAQWIHNQADVENCMLNIRPFDSVWHLATMISSTWPEKELSRVVGCL